MEDFVLDFEYEHGGVTAMPLRFITSPDDLHSNIDSFIVTIRANPEVARDVLRRARYIVCRRAPFVVGAPSKFVAYEEMSGERYPKAGSEAGVPFNGTRARVAIELVLGDQFVSDDGLRAEFASWVDAELPGVREGIDSEKWCFILLPSRSDAASTVVGQPEPRLDNWPNYSASQEAYARCWYAYNDELYAMVARRRGHTVLADVVAKVGILARAYATQLERHASGDGDGAILDVAAALHAVGADFDAKIEELRPRAGMPGGLDLDTLVEVVRLHAWVSERKPPRIGGAPTRLTG